MEVFLLLVAAINPAHCQFGYYPHALEHLPEQIFDEKPALLPPGYFGFHAGLPGLDCQRNSDCPCGSEWFYCSKKRKSCVFKCGSLCGTRSCDFVMKKEQSCTFDARNVYCDCRKNFLGVTECQAPFVREININENTTSKIPPTTPKPRHQKTTTKKAKFVSKTTPLTSTELVTQRPQITDLPKVILTTESPAQKINNLLDEANGTRSLFPDKTIVLVKNITLTADVDESPKGVRLESISDLNQTEAKFEQNSVTETETIEQVLPEDQNQVTKVPENVFVVPIELEAVTKSSSKIVTKIDQVTEDPIEALESVNTTFSYNTAIRYFTQNIFIELSKGNPGNLVFSPLSLHVALTMLARGGSKNTTTRVELLQALGFRGKYRRYLLRDLETFYKDLFEKYQADTQVLTITNGLWTQPDVVSIINEKYLDHINKTYNAQVMILPNESPESAVNNWVKRVTQGKIQKIVGSVDPSTVLLLTNAVYFSEAWTVAFTLVPNPVLFTLSSGEQVPVKMMTRSSHEIVTGTFKFTNILPEMKMFLVTLRYSNDAGRYQMVLIMPEDPTGLDQLVKSIESTGEHEQIFLEIYQAALEADLSVLERSVIMPLFSVKSELKMEKYLRKLGVQRAFDNGEFGNLVNNVSLKVSSIRHVANIDVTLEGTVGAAATGVEIVPLSAIFDQPEEVLVDKPFIFLVKDTQLDTIIFCGKITNPNS